MSDDGQLDYYTQTLVNDAASTEADSESDGWPETQIIGSDPDLPEQLRDLRPRSRRMAALKAENCIHGYVPSVLFISMTSMCPRTGSICAEGVWIHRHRKRNGLTPTDWLIKLKKRRRWSSRMVNKTHLFF